MTDWAEPRAVRRARVRMVRPRGRKGARAVMTVARHEAGLLVEEALMSRSEARARDRRNGVMRHVDADGRRTHA